MDFKGDLPNHCFDLIILTETVVHIKLNIVVNLGET